jgi:hypothetical protein
LLNDDFRDMLSAFAEADVKYLLVGAYAMAAHGYVRATGDIDLWIDRSRENAERVMDAMAAFGAPLHDLKVGDLEAPDLVFQMGVAPRRIDILTSVDGVGFEEAWPERYEVRISDLTVPVISRHHLSRNKRATGRLKDAADAAWLEGEA